MFPYPQTVNPAVRSHIDAQTAFFSDMSKSFFQSFEQLAGLNIQLTKTLFEESTLASKELVNTERQSDLASAASARVQPTTDKLRAYHQQLSRLAADTQVSLTQVLEKHAPITSRTARTLSDEVARDATEHTEQNLRTQQEAVRQFTDPFEASKSAHATQSATPPQAKSDKSDTAAPHVPDMPQAAGPGHATQNQSNKASARDAASH